MARRGGRFFDRSARRALSLQLRGINHFDGFYRVDLCKAVVGHEGIELVISGEDVCIRRGITWSRYRGDYQQAIQEADFDRCSYCPVLLTFPDHHLFRWLLFNDVIKHHVYIASQTVCLIFQKKITRDEFLGEKKPAYCGLGWCWCLPRTEGRRQAAALAREYSYATQSHGH